MLKKFFKKKKDFEPLYLKQKKRAESAEFKLEKLIAQVETCITEARK